MALDGIWWQIDGIDGTFTEGTRADQLLPQLSMEQLILCLYNVNILNICMKEFGSEKIIFDKMTAVRT